MVEEDISATDMEGWFSKFWTDKFNVNGIKVDFRALIPTVENTKEAIEGGADIIIATGFDDGGTIPEKPISTFSIVHMIVDAAEDKVPVMAAGVSLMKELQKLYLY